MNKLLTPNGGMPLDGDDFQWIQDGLLEAFRGSLWWAIAGGENQIIRGCEITLVGLDASITAGFAVIGGEVCYVPAHTETVSSLAGSSLKIDESYDATGLEVFADSVSRDTYAIRRALISDGLNSGDEIVLDSPGRIYYDQAFADGDLENGWLTSGTNTVRARLFNGEVSLEGAITAGDTNLTLITLPAIFRPLKQRVCVIGNSDVDTFLIAVVQTDGQVIAINSGSQVTYSAGKSLFLDAIRYHK